MKPVDITKRIVVVFVKEGSIDWPRDVKTSKRLQSFIKDPIFWQWVEPDYKCNFLHWFLTNDGKLWLRDKHQRFLKIRSQIEKEIKFAEMQKFNQAADPILLEFDKIGEDLEIPAKSKTTLDFLK